MSDGLDQTRNFRVDDSSEDTSIGGLLLQGIHNPVQEKVTLTPVSLDAIYHLHEDEEVELVELRAKEKVLLFAVVHAEGGTLLYLLPEYSEEEDE